MAKRIIAALAAAVLALSLSGCGLVEGIFGGINEELGISAGQSQDQGQEQQEYRELSFRSRSKLMDHYRRHGKEMGFKSAEEYEEAAEAVANNPKALHKTEAKDGDDVYYLEATNEIVFVSTDGYIRTYFCPDSGKAYFNRQ